MSQPVREIVLLPPTTLTATGQGPAIVIPAGFSAAIIYFTQGAPAGTTETLNMVIQQGFRATSVSDTVAGAGIASSNPTIWDDYASFAQVTTSAAVQVMRILAGTGTSGANAPTASVGAASPSAALAASTIRPGPLGMWWRMAWVISGTSPSYPTVAVSAQFLEPQG